MSSNRRSETESEHYTVSVLIMGVTGMLGHQMVKEFESLGIETLGTSRDMTSGRANAFEFDALESDVDTFLDRLPRLGTIINNIGVIKTHIVDVESDSVLNAVRINAEFPHHLARAAARRDIQVIQIATDCVFSGQQGSYDENFPANAWDVYGKTKSLGEVHLENVMHLRCSIIGRENQRNTSLVEWVLNQRPNATISGYTNHRWNGITTLAFSRICAGVIQSKLHRPGVHHVVPRNQVTKAELVRMIAETFNRSDIVVRPVQTERDIDRTLATLTPEFSESLWRAAGYSEVPSIETLLSEYGDSYRKSEM